MTLAVFVALFAHSHLVYAEDDILLVPYAPNNPDLPHPIHEGARITLKGIMRNAHCGSYTVIWDTDRDGNFETDGQDAKKDVSPWNKTVYDLSVYYEVPAVSGGDQRWPINVQVRNNCNGSESLATYKMFAYDWRPSTNPSTWTAEQVEVMGQIAIQESLWYFHRRMERSGINAQMTGYPSSFSSGYRDNTFAGAALSLWAFAINGYLPAFPTGSGSNFKTSHVTPSATWYERNTYRWEHDPYAETTARIVNKILERGTGWRDITSGDESDECNLVVQSNGRNRRSDCPRLPGTKNSKGAYTNGYSNSVYYQGLTMSSVIAALPALAGSQLQTGGLDHLKWENFAQELTDYMGYMQIDSGCARGGWYYSASNNNLSDCRYMDASTAQWGYIAMETAEVVGKPFGIIVSNRHKYNAAWTVMRNLDSAGSAQYRTDHGGDNLMLTGGSLLVARWVGVDKLPNSGSARNEHPFAPYDNDYTAREYHDKISKMRNYTSARWGSSRSGGHSRRRFWTTGNYLCGNTSSVYRWGNGANCGNLYGIYSHQKGYRTGTPEEASPKIVDGFTWDQQFSIYTMRSQYREASHFDNKSFGYIHDCGYSDSQIACYYGGSVFTTAVGVLILTPTLFNPKPVAIGTVSPSPTTVFEGGCIPSPAANITFEHSGSFHPNAESQIVKYQWDVDKADGYWWDNNGTPDFEVGATYTDDQGRVLLGRDKPFIYAYPRARASNYIATLRVEDNIGKFKMMEFEVQVLPVPNDAPSASHNGPYVLEVGQDLVLRGAASDNNVRPNNVYCDDRLTVGWDLDGDGEYDDYHKAATGLNGTPVAWSFFSGFEVARPYQIKIQAVDSHNAVSDPAVTELTIYPKEPTAEATILPNPSQCQQEVTFNAGGSYHLNPDRQIIEYSWDIDANINPGVDGGGNSPIFKYRYPKYGSYDIVLTVKDNEDNTDTFTSRVDVNQGNNAPIARVAQSRMTKIELQDIPLDASPSYDNNVDCGDRIVSFEWDIDGDGSYGSAQDLTTDQPRVVLSWEEAAQRLGWNGQDLSLTRLITVRVTDSFGAQTTAQMELVVYKADPVARFDQRPSPAPIDEETGRVEVVLDARESYSPIPDGQIINYEWDFDCSDGNPQFIEGVGEAVITFRRIFENLDPANVPRPVVCLQVTDHRGSKVSIQKAIEYGIGAVPPTPDADPSDSPELGYHILMGGNLTLSGAQSIEPNRDDFVRYYRWRLNYNPDAEDPQTLTNWDIIRQDVNGDREEAVTVVSAAELEQFGINDLGTYPLVMEVEDTTFLTSRDRSTITVHPIDPIASASIDPPVAACGQRITLDGSGSGHEHPFIDIAEWAWDMNGDGDFDDPEDAFGERTTVNATQFTFDGPIPVTLRVTDSEGRSASTQLNLRVDQGNSAPSVNAGGPYVIAAGDPVVSFDASGSNDPDESCGDEIVHLRWDIGNNGSYEDAFDNQTQIQLTWQQLISALGSSAQGRYPVRVWAIDRFGLSNEHIVNLDIVEGPTAIASVTPSRPACNATIEFNGGGSFTDGPLDRGFELRTYEWDFNQDGVTDATGRSVLRNAIGDGQLSATLTVTDASGRKSSATTTYTISNNNLPPQASAGGPYMTTIIGGVRQPIDLDARATTDTNIPCDAVTSYDWDTDGDGLFGAEDTNGINGVGGSDAVGALVRAHVNTQWRVGLSYILKVRACDTKGACHIAETDLEVSDNAPPIGEIIYPRAEDCVGDVNFPVQISFRDPDPNGGAGPVQVKVIVDGATLHQEEVSVEANVQVDRSILIDAGRFSEGYKNLRVELTDDDGATSVLTTGGPVAFDRTPPVLSISNLLLAEACYRANEVPDLNITVSDSIDPAPQVNESTSAQDCERFLTVEAVDHCGNETVITRDYRVAGPVAFELQGPEEGELVANGTFTWQLNTVCANPVTAKISENGQERIYRAGEPLDVPGSYTFTLTVPNCVGERAQERRAFTINAPPVSRPVPSGHPNADSLALSPTYIVTEGAPLRVEGDDSITPELNDSIVAYRWDFDGNGTFDVVGDATAAARTIYPTDEDGAFEGSLQVEDSFGLTHQQRFEVIIHDVHPTVNAGGPYSPAQGEAQLFDASLSRAANSADPITAIKWIWGDGTDTGFVEPGDFKASHTYRSDGQFEATLIVRDEDSERRQIFQVSVRDVPPSFGPDSVSFAPELPYALQDVAFEIDARSGDIGDPLISFDFDFKGDGNYVQFPASSSTVVYQYPEASPPGQPYQVELIIRDADSLARLTFPLTVRPVTLVDLLNEISAIVARLVDEGGPARALSALNPDGQPSARDWVEQGLWAEAQYEALDSGDPSHDARMRSMYRGGTLMAFDELLFRLNRAQSAGADISNILWKVSRQLLRETEAYAEETLSSDPNALLSDNYRQAQLYLDAARALYHNVDFKDRVSRRDGYLARDLFAALSEAHFALRGYTDLSTVYNHFPMPSEGPVRTRMFNANVPASHVKEAFDQLFSELTTYLETAEVEDDLGPGVSEVRNALATLEQLRTWAAEPIGNPCLIRSEWDPEDPECQTIDDTDSLYLQLGLMDLIADLFAAADQGVYVRSAQDMLTRAVSFRVEAALTSVQDECGYNSPLMVGARAQQQVMLNLLDRGQSDAALLYYIAPERRCLVTRIYNECVVPVRNATALPEELLQLEPYPELCEQVGFGDNEVQLNVGFEPPIPLRAAFTDLTLLYMIVSAFIQNVDLANPTQRANFINQYNQGIGDQVSYTWADFNRFSADNAFNIDDVDTSIQQFNHDQIDYDGDGLLGVIEIDCRVRFGVPLNPNNPASTGIPDGELDCDGDQIPNGEEVALGLNPVEPDDADIDTDLDGVSNYLEWYWSKQGLPLDLRDPLDVYEDEDMDGMNNRLEILNGLDPLRPQDATGDIDNDGLTNAQEVLNGLNPRDAGDADIDPDGDGLTSRQEILRGRNPLVADCESDSLELLGRDDAPENARPLMFEGTPERTLFSDGTICGAPGSEDVDWFVVDIPEQQARLVAHLKGQSAVVSELSIRLYRREDLAQVAVSSTLYESEVLVAARGQLDAGEYLLRVAHDERDQAPESPYTLDVMLISATPPCLPDPFEGPLDNNRRSSATPLGASEVRRGDVWICEAERNTGDWYSVEMLDNDKTVHIGYSPNTDGKLELGVMTQDLGTYVESADIQKSSQCINIRASGAQDIALINVVAASVFADGDERVDYVLQVVDTDLDANPRGACDDLNRGLYDFHPWPTLEMP